MSHDVGRHAPEPDMPRTVHSPTKEYESSTERHVEDGRIAVDEGLITGVSDSY
jgi:hypothetical protein